MNGSDLSQLLYSNKANMVQARDAIYAINNASLYDYIDAMKETKELDEETAIATEALTKKILSKVDALEALNYANHPEKVEALVKALNGAKVDGIEASEILTSDDYSLKDKLEAYDAAAATLSRDAAALGALEEAFNEFKIFQEMNESAIEFIDNASLSYDQINELHDITRQLNKELKDSNFKITEDSDTVFKNLLNDLSTSGGDIASSINRTFGTYLNEMSAMGED